MLYWLSYLHTIPNLQFNESVRTVEAARIERNRRLLPKILASRNAMSLAQKDMQPYGWDEDVELAVMRRLAGAR